jgi:glycine/D-amino acid oxidase-like deaminating enzyme
VFTEKGDIVAERAVNCGGLWARVVGLELPILAMEHHYLITEDNPGVIDPKVDRFYVISKARSTCARKAAAC